MEKNGTHRKMYFQLIFEFKFRLIISHQVLDFWEKKVSVFNKLKILEIIINKKENFKRRKAVP
jgi:hypothetical protein